MEQRNRYDQKLISILERACGIFADRGFHNTSIRDVASATGVSPAGLYYYFQSKDELLYLILENTLSSLVDGIRRQVDGFHNPRERLRAIVRTHLDQFAADRKGMRVLVHEWEALSGSYGESVREFMRSYVSMVVETFRDLSPGRNEMELRAAAFGLFGMLTWVDQWYRSDRDLPVPLLAEEFSSIFLGEFLRGGEDQADRARAGNRVDGGEWDGKSPTSSILSGPGF